MEESSQIGDNKIVILLTSLDMRGIGFNIRTRIYPDNLVIRQKLFVSGYIFHPNTRILFGYNRVIRIKFQYFISG